MNAGKTRNKECRETDAMTHTDTELGGPKQLNDQFFFLSKSCESLLASKFYTIKTKRDQEYVF